MVCSWKCMGSNLGSRLALAALGSLLLGASAFGGTPTTTNITVRPGSPEATAPYSPLGIADDSAPGWGNGSWKANIPAGPPVSSNYSQVILLPLALFGREVTVNELVSISYWTKKGTPATAVDWFFQFYTKEYAGDPSPGSNWYGHRLNAENYFAANLNAPAGAWNQWSSDAGQNQLRFYDSSNGYFGGYDDGSLDDLIATTYPAPQFHIPGTHDPLGPQEILYFRVGLGTAWGAGFTGQIDGIRIELTDGSVANINLEPGTLTLEADDSLCYKPGVDDIISVDIKMNGMAGIITGGQFFLEYDSTVLQYMGATHNPGFDLIPIMNTHTPGSPTGLINYGVTDNPPFAGLTGDAVLVTLTFKALVNVCGDDPEHPLVWFRDYIIPTRLSDNMMTNIEPDLVDLNPVTIDGTAPTIHNPVTSDIVVAADAGDCLGTNVSWNVPSATDNCSTPTLTSTPPAPGSFFTVVGSPHTVTYTFQDDCGNTSTNEFTITVLPVNEMVVTVELYGGIAAGPFTRCITFNLSGTNSATVDALMTFTGGSATATIQVPCGDYDCVVARDKLHTLARAQPVTINGNDQYTTSFLGAGSGLLSGNLNDDPYIDILDFGIFVFQYNQNIGANTTCATLAPHADVTGDGIVESADYSHISTNFLKFSETCPIIMALLAGHPVSPDLAATQGFGGPRASISVRELQKMGLGHLAVADRNGDQVVDATDMAIFLGGGMK